LGNCASDYERSRSQIEVSRRRADIPRMDVPAIALQGLQAAEAQLEAAASAIAKAGASTSDGAGIDIVSLSSEMVAMMAARNLFELNVATLKTANEMQRNLLDIRA
jgi:flagellar basal body rod protein FlgC